MQLALCLTKQETYYSLQSMLAASIYITPDKEEGNIAKSRAKGEL